MCFDFLYKVCSKHVELILEINKLLLLHLVGFLYYFSYIDDAGQTQIKNELLVLISSIKFARNVYNSKKNRAIYNKKC